MSEPKELDFILLLPLRLWYKTRWNLNASVCVYLTRVFVLMREVMTYMLLFFRVGGGLQGSCLFFWVMMFMFWHIRAVSACKHEPFDCTVVSLLSQQVVRPIRTLSLMVFSVRVMRERGPATFCFGVLIWGLAESLFV